MHPPLDPTAPAVRRVRAAVLTVPAVGVAAAAHGLDGGAVRPVGLAVCLVLCWPAAVWVLGRPRLLTALVAWLAGAQLVTHAVLMQLGPQMDGMQMHGMQMDRHPYGLGPGMIGLHLAGLVLTSYLLHRADAGLWATDALYRAARAWRVRPVQVVRPATSVPLMAVVVVPRALPGRWSAARPDRRGPPGRLALAS